MIIQTKQRTATPEVNTSVVSRTEEFYFCQSNSKNDPLLNMVLWVHEHGRAVHPEVNTSVVSGTAEFYFHQSNSENYHLLGMVSRVHQHGRAAHRCSV